MEVKATEIPEVVVVHPDVHGDARGYFFEAFCRRRYEALGLPGDFVQDNVSFSRRGVLRGLHFQQPQGQAKLVFVLQGEVFDVIVDIRAGSPTFRRWVAVNLSAENRRQLYVPVGFAHGFCALSETVLLAYKCSDYYNPATERSIRWDDAEIGIDWPKMDFELSRKDADAPLLGEISMDQLPVYGREHA